MKTKGSKNKHPRPDKGVRRGTKIPKRACDYCKEVFQPDCSIRKYCSNACRYGALRTPGIRRKIRHDTHAYRKWRTMIFERDNFTCKRCLVQGGKLRAHHIYPWARFPEKRYEMVNGVTLCKKCHDFIHLAMEHFRVCEKCQSSQTEIHSGDKVILVGSIFGDRVRIYEEE